MAQQDLLLPAFALLVAVGVYLLVPILTSPLNKYPGPRLAAFSRLWLAKAARHGIRSVTVHEEHLKHGTFVRIGPNEGGFSSLKRCEGASADRHSAPHFASLHRTPRCTSDRLRVWDGEHQVGFL